ncbi:hypothetical protein ACVIGB_005223 [Bradyrhizobium sp. USDA 4341]
MNDESTSMAVDPFAGSFDGKPDEVRVEVLLPIYFDESHYPELDDLMRQENRIAAETFASAGEGDPGWPTTEEFRKLLLEVTDLAKQRRMLASNYCSRFGNLASQAIGFDLELRFEKLLDYRSWEGGERILATMPNRTVARLHDLSASDGHRKLKALKPYGYGGSSRKFAADVEAWLENSPFLWDEMKLSFLPASLLVDGSVIDAAVIDRCMHLDAEQAFEDAVDWEWFDRKDAQLIAWKKADLARNETPKVTI